MHVTAATPPTCCKTWPTKEAHLQTTALCCLPLLPWPTHLQMIALYCLSSCSLLAALRLRMYQGSGCSGLTYACATSFQLQRNQKVCTDTTQGIGECDCN